MLVHCLPLSLAYSFSKSEMGFYMCAVWCVHRHGTSCFKSNPRRLGNVQLIPYTRGLQQNERRECELNLCPSTCTGSQVQLPTPMLLTSTNSISNVLGFTPEIFFTNKFFFHLLYEFSLIWRKKGLISMLDTGHLTGTFGKYLVHFQG